MNSVQEMLKGSKSKMPLLNASMWFSIFSVVAIFLYIVLVYLNGSFHTLCAGYSPFVSIDWLILYPFPPYSTFQKNWLGWDPLPSGFQLVLAKGTYCQAVWGWKERGQSIHFSPSLPLCCRCSRLHFFICKSSCVQHSLRHRACTLGSKKHCLPLSLQDKG